MSRIVKLNVGGKRFETTEMTLTRIPDSMLARMVQHPNEVEKIKQGQELFIDRDGEYFGFMLDYLRSGAHIAIPQDTDLRGRLITEADFYQLSGLADLIKQASTLKVGDVVQLQDSDVARSYFKSVIGRSETYNYSYICWQCQGEFVFSQCIGNQVPGILLSSLHQDCRKSGKEIKYELVVGKIIAIDGQCATVSVAKGCVLAALLSVRLIKFDMKYAIHIPLPYLKMSTQ